MQNLHQSTQDLEIVYPEKSYEDGQLLIRPLLRKAKDTNMAAG
jgi:hypothetical protein